MYPPDCNRQGCRHPQSAHDAQPDHECNTGGCSCGSFVFPPGVQPYYPLLPACPRAGCGHSPELHDLLDPHKCNGDPMSSVCECDGYDFAGSGHEPPTYQGGGGGFGGGGASGGW